MLVPSCRKEVLYVGRELLSSLRQSKVQSNTFTALGRGVVDLYVPRSKGIVCDGHG